MQSVDQRLNQMLALVLELLDKALHARLGILAQVVDKLTVKSVRNGKPFW